MRTGERAEADVGCSGCRVAVIYVRACRATMLRENHVNTHKRGIESEVVLAHAMTAGRSFRRGRGECIPNMLAAAHR
jgi:hypothetical protein